MQKLVEQYRQQSRKKHISDRKSTTSLDRQISEEF